VTNTAQKEVDSPMAEEVAKKVLGDKKKRDERKRQA